MKLKQRFSLIAALCGIELLILTSLTMVGADFIQRLQNFQFNEQECQYSLVDMVNFLNQTIYWSSDTAQALNDAFQSTGEEDVKQDNA